MARDIVHCDIDIGKPLPLRRGYVAVCQEARAALMSDKDKLDKFLEDREAGVERIKNGLKMFTGKDGECGP